MTQFFLSSEESLNAAIMGINLKGFKFYLWPGAYIYKAFAAQSFWNSCSGLFEFHATNPYKEWHFLLGKDNLSQINLRFLSVITVFCGKTFFTGNLVIYSGKSGNQIFWTIFIYNHLFTIINIYIYMKLNTYSWKVRYILKCRFF